LPLFCYWNRIRLEFFLSEEKAVSSLTIALPNRIHQHLQAELGTGLERTAQEALAVEGYRSGILSLGEVAEILNLSINDADGFLKKRGIPSLITSQDLKADTDGLLKLLS
jgi:predicted HTH domain antitoxin